MSHLPDEQDVWYLIRSYYERHGMVRHQIESFNYFIHTLLPHIVQESSEIRVRQGDDEEHVVSLCNVSIERPTTTDVDGTERDLYPHMARLRSLTYSSAVMVDVVHDIFRNGERVERRLFRETCLCRLPIMLGTQTCHTQHRESSMECRLDQGGYFIVSGCEKVLVAQEKLHHNVPYVFSVKQPSRFALQCEIRSCHERKLRSTSSLYVYITNAKKGATPEMVVTLPFVNMQVPVLALFRLLGADTRQAAMEAIVGDGQAPESRLLSSILDNDSTADMCVTDLYEYIGREGTRETTREKRQRYIDHIINCEVLPHQGLTQTPEVMRAKALYLGLMIRKLIRVYVGELQCDDRDHIATKRVDCAGTQFGLLFRQVFRTVQKSITMQLHRAADTNKLAFTNVGSLVAGKKLTQAFRYALATGNWGIMSTRGNTAQSGVAQQLGRMTSASTLSLLRKVSTPVARETKNPKPRQLHHTAWGLICPMDTPEGAACGLTKSIAMLAHIRIGTFSDAIREQLDELYKEEGTVGIEYALTASSTQRRGGLPVLINGTLYMYAESSEVASQLVERLRLMRSQHAIPFDTTVAQSDGHVVIDTDPGCLLRPLIRVAMLHQMSDIIHNAPSHTDLMDYLVRTRVVEYVDKQEEAAYRVAISPLKDPEEGWDVYTHCEIDPSLIVGLCGALIPFAEFNQSPRNTYQSAMMKQALGVPTLNHTFRMDTVLHTMVCPQRPIVTTRMDELVGASDAPAGINAIVAIMCYTGQNQEDSVIVNKAALDRGLFRSIKYQTYRDEEHQNGGSDAERFKNVANMQSVSGKRDANYDHLEDSGIVAVGTRVQPNDVIISKTVTTTDLGEGARRSVERDKSTVLKNESGIVDSVLRVINQDGTRIAKVKIRNTRTPIVGDKLCHSRDHDFLTARGWVPCADVTTEDLALTLDPDTNTMAYEPVLETHRYECVDEDLYEIDSQQVSLCVTLNHRMWVKKRDALFYDFAYAKDIVGKRVSYLKNCPNGLSATTLPPIPVPNKDRVEDFLYFMGFWYGDGCASSDGRVVITQKRPVTRERILHISECLGLHYVKFDPSVSIDIRYCRTKNPELSAFFTPLSTGALNKTLPRWALQMSVEHSRALLQGLLDSDGSKTNAEQSVFYTSSVQLRDDVQALALNCGYAANYKMNRDEGFRHPFEGRDIIANAPNWRVGIVTSKCQPTVNHGHIHQQKRQTERLVKYTGSVHCISVRTGIFYVRRRGVGCWTGNSSRMGQKGVIGATLAHEDMPYTADGIVPDIIVNPHAIPSRMTIGQMSECLLSILCTLTGERGDGTMFRGTSLEYLADQLEKAGYDRHGRVKLHNGFTGEGYEALIFMGPTYYQRLRHMAADKDHARARGPVHMLSRQPTEGRARDGGLRFGEMERDTLIAHGAAEFLKDRLLDNSDPSTMTVCGKCGLLAQPAADGTHVRHKEAWCKNCGSGADVHTMHSPYAFRLLLQELQAMSIGIRFDF